MSNRITDDCSSGLHDYCTPCQCECHPNVKKLQELEQLVLNLQAHAKEHGWQDYDEPIAALLSWEPTIPEKCECKILDRQENEEQREWLKRCMCMHHWMQTQYYRNKLNTIWLGTEGA